jgi:ATP-dependent protease ClpP protease subunit
LSAKVLQIAPNLILVYGSIEAADGLELSEKLDAAKSDANIIIAINSPGGRVTALKNMIDSIEKNDDRMNIITDVRRYAGSAAAILFLFGEDRRMHSAANLFFHTVSYWDEANGKRIPESEWSPRMKEHANRLNTWLANIICEMTPQEDTIQEVLTWMNGYEGVTVNAKTAMEMGLITEIY